MNKLYTDNEQQNLFNTLKGKVITDVHGLDKNSKHVSFLFSDGSCINMFHYQDCSEEVIIDDICGDIDDLLNAMILDIELVTSNTDRKDEWDESFTWSFYKIKTNKGYVTIKWYGVSNGFYSETVDIEYFELDKNWEQNFIYN